MHTFSNCWATLFQLEFLNVCLNSCHRHWPTHVLRDRLKCHIRLVKTEFWLGKLYEVVAKSQLKKLVKVWQQEVRKAEEKAKRDVEAEEATRKKAEEAKKVTIEEVSML